MPNAGQLKAQLLPCPVRQHHPALVTPRPTKWLSHWSRRRPTALVSAIQGNGSSGEGADGSRSNGKAAQNGQYNSLKDYAEMAYLAGRAKGVTKYFKNAMVGVLGDCGAK